MAHPHAARLTARGQGRWLRLASGVAEGARRVGGASGSAGASGAVGGARRVGGAFRVGGGSAARFRGGEVFGTLEEERRVGGGFGATKASAAAGFRRAEGARRVPRVGGDTDWWWLGSRGLCGGGGSRVDGASGRLFPGGVWRRFFDVIEAAQASYTQAGGNRLLRGPILMQPENPAFAGTNPNAAGKSPILRVNCVPPAPIKNHLRCRKWLIVNCRGDWIRTSDPLLPKQVR